MICHETELIPAHYQLNCPEGFVSVVAEGAAVEPLVFAKIVLLAIDARLRVRLVVKFPPPERPVPALIETELSA